MPQDAKNRPILGVGAVIVQAGRVALIRRANEPFRGEWSIPGGRVELGEALRDAVMREALEETGLSVEVGDLLEVYESIIPDPGGSIRFHHVVLDYACAVVSGTLCAGADALEARWVTPDELRELRVSEAARRIINKALKDARSERYS